MVDILAIAGYSGARLYRGQSSLLKIVVKPSLLCCRVLRRRGVEKLRTRVSASESFLSSRPGAGAQSAARVVHSYYSAIDRERINAFRRYTCREWLVGRESFIQAWSHPHGIHSESRDFEAETYFCPTSQFVDRTLIDFFLSPSVFLPLSRFSSCSC